VLDVMKNKRPMVFLSGPIQGMERNQSYRDVLGNISNRCGFEVIDPWLREKVVYKGYENGWWNRVPPLDFIKRDLEDIDRCDILVAYIPKLSAGTCMELFYAKLKGKMTITICKLKNPSPWITAHTDIMINKMEDLEKALKRTKSSV